MSGGTYLSRLYLNALPQSWLCAQLHGNKQRSHMLCFQTQWSDNVEARLVTASEMVRNERQQTANAVYLYRPLAKGEELEDQVRSGLELVWLLFASSHCATTMSLCSPI